MQFAKLNSCCFSELKLCRINSVSMLNELTFWLHCQLVHVLLWLKFGLQMSGILRNAFQNTIHIDEIQVRLHISFEMLKQNRFVHVVHQLMSTESFPLLYKMWCLNGIHHIPIHMKVVFLFVRIQFLWVIAFSIDASVAVDSPDVCSISTEVSHSCSQISPDYSANCETQIRMDGKIFCDCWEHGVFTQSGR